MKKKTKTGLIIILAVIALWITLGIIDFSRVHGFEKPIFCITQNAADDGGSGHYTGLGYAFDIEGNFMPEDELPGVTKWTYYLLGTKISTGIRD